MNAEMVGANREDGGAGKRRIIIGFGNRNLRELFTTLMQRTDGSVRGIPVGQITMLRTAIAATESGIALTGSERSGYRLKISKNVQVVLPRPIDDVQLPSGPGIPIVRFSGGNQDLGKPHYPRDPLQ